MTNLEKIVCDLCDCDISDFLVYIAQMKECVFPHKLNCTVCPFFHLCMFVEFPVDEIRKWLESEIGDGDNAIAVCGGGMGGVRNGKAD